MMQRVLAFVLPTVLVVCASSLKISAMAATEAASGAKANRPDVKVGDQWKFQCVDYYGVKSDRLWVITSIDQAGIKGTENGQPLVLTPDMNVLESPRRKDSDLRLLSFPLEVGKQWTAVDKFVSEEGRLESEGSSNLSVAVAGYEKVRVVAGEFDAFKLESNSTYTTKTSRSSSIGSAQSTYWYAPAAHIVVKRETFIKAARDACELVEFRLQP